MERTRWTDERMDDLALYVRESFDALRADNAALRTDNAALRTELLSEIHAVRRDLWFAFIAIFAAVVSTNLA